jgi:tetratricopeptide (TPR) repeat protein
MGTTTPAKQRPDVRQPKDQRVAAPTGYTKKETVWLVGLVTLVVGFVAGVAFSVYKQGAGPSMVPMPHDQAGEVAAIAARIPDLVQQAAGHPDEPAHWIELGNAYYDTEQPDKAIDAYQKALALNPANPDVWTDMGVMYRKHGLPEKAIASFDKAIDLNSRHEIARFNKGVVLMHDLNNRGEALRVWEQLLAINPQAKAPGGQPLKDMLDRFKAEPSR